MLNHLIASIFFFVLQMIFYLLQFSLAFVDINYLWQVFFPLPFVEYHPRIVIVNEMLQTIMKKSYVETAHETGKIDPKIRSSKTFLNGADMFMSEFRAATFKRNIRPLTVHKVRLNATISLFFSRFDDVMAVIFCK